MDFSSVQYCTILPTHHHSICNYKGWCWFKDEKDIDHVWRYVLFYAFIWLGIIYMIGIYIRAWWRIRKMGGGLGRIYRRNEDSTTGTGRSSGISVGISVGIDTQSTKDPTIEMDEIAGNNEDKDRTNVANNNRESRASTSNHQHKKRTKALSRMILFPLILIVGWSVGSVRRLMELFDATTPAWLISVHVGMYSMIGFWDAVVYGFTKDVREKDKEWCLKKCGDAEYEDD